MDGIVRPSLYYHACMHGHIHASVMQQTTHAPLLLLLRVPAEARVRLEVEGLGLRRLVLGHLQFIMHTYKDTGCMKEGTKVERMSHSYHHPRLQGKKGKLAHETTKSSHT